MRFEIREGEIEMIPETEFDRDVIEKLHRKGRNREIKIRDGETTDPDYPPSDRETNIIFDISPDGWGT